MQLLYLIHSLVGLERAECGINISTTSEMPKVLVGRNLQLSKSYYKAQWVERPTKSGQKRLTDIVLCGQLKGPDAICPSCTRFKITTP